LRNPKLAAGQVYSELENGSSELGASEHEGGSPNKQPLFVPPIPRSENFTGCLDFPPQHEQIGSDCRRPARACAELFFPPFLQSSSLRTFHQSLSFHAFWSLFLCFPFHLLAARVAEDTSILAFRSTAHHHTRKRMSAEVSRPQREVAWLWLRCACACNGRVQPPLQQSTGFEEEEQERGTPLHRRFCFWFLRKQKLVRPSMRSALLALLLAARTHLLASLFCASIGVPGDRLLAPVAGADGGFVRGQHQADRQLPDGGALLEAVRPPGQARPAQAAH